MILNPNSLIPQAMRAITFTLQESQNPKYQMKVQRLLQKHRDKLTKDFQVPAEVSTNNSGDVSSFSTPRSTSWSLTVSNHTPAEKTPTQTEELSPPKKL